MERVLGFEILPAPYVVAHLQIGLLLHSFGSELSQVTNERVSVYLTNSLTGWYNPDEPWCGEVNPSFKCGLNDIGPGNSIHGANSHPDVITVAAVSINKNWLPYSSQGPGGLEPKKPDISAYSEFRGSGIDTLDGGTSAATPLAAGMAAALRQKIPSGIMKPLEFKKILIQNAFRSEGGDGWNAKTGNGIINTRGLENYFQ